MKRIRGTCELPECCVVSKLLDNFTSQGVGRLTVYSEIYWRDGKMKKYFRLAMVLVVTVCAIQTADAAIIEYTATNIGVDRWQYDYTIYNDSQIDIVAFEIDFSFNGGPYSDLELLTWYSGRGWGAELWPEIIIGDKEVSPWQLSGAADYEQPQPLLPGEKLEGYVVAFNWSGQGDPGSQMFHLWGSDWTEFDTGWTSAVSPIPEPGTLVLLGTGVVGLAAYYRRRTGSAKRENDRNS